MTAPVFGQTALCRYCRGKGEGRTIGNVCLHCSGTGIEPQEHAPTRRDSPETSFQAARSVKVADGKRHVLSCLIAYGPQTDAQLEERLYPTLSRSGVRTRRNELVVDGLVVDTGRTVTLRSGRSAKVWAAK